MAATTNQPTPSPALGRQPGKSPSEVHRGRLPQSQPNQHSERKRIVFTGQVEAAARTLELCGRGALIGTHTTTGDVRIVPLHCGRWDCPVCGERKRRYWLARLASGAPERFITITCRPQPNRTPDEAAHALKRNWSRFVDHWRRQRHTCEYAWCLQWHANGWPHLHILQRGSYIPHKLLSTYMLKSMGSPIVDIRRLHSVKQAVCYAGRYMLRTTPHDKPQANHQYRCYTSANYESDHTIRRKCQPDPAWVWTYYRGTVAEAAHEVELHNRHQYMTISLDGCLILSQAVSPPNLIPIGTPAPDNRGISAAGTVHRKPPGAWLPNLAPPGTAID